MAAQAKAKPKGRPRRVREDEGHPVFGFDVTVQRSQIAEYASLRPRLDETFKKWVCQLEASPTTGTEHWQIRGLLFKRMRLHAAIAAFPDLPGHWSITSTSGSQNFSYVMKADTRVVGPFKNTDPLPPTETRQLREFLTKEKYPWQVAARELVQRIDDRRITLILDTNGNNGKSIFTEWIEFDGLAVEVPAMNNYEDLMQACLCIGPKPAYVVDLPRGMKKEKMAQFFSGLESLKNGVVYDKRYQFRKIRFDRPQVVVFTNTMPDISLMSIDRWEIYRITPGHELVAVDRREIDGISRLREHDTDEHEPARARRRTLLFEHDGSLWRDHAQAQLGYRFCLS